MPVCEICGKTLKNPKAKSHINSKGHQNALKKLQITTVSPKTVTNASSKSAYQPASDYEHRIELLENQVKFIMEKLNAIDIRLSSSEPVNLEIADLRPVKKRVKQLISRGESMILDTLMKDKKMKDFRWNIVEKALLELIDDEEFDVAEGNSRIKIAGNIARLIRR
ncbi:MAG: C2H2-type zinc finger protein [Candidatus Hodarchaeales archaeon]